jgi:hypothetical protein
LRIVGRTDRNQREISAALRAAGCSVESLHRVGGGVPDLIVGRKGRNYLLEIKDGALSPSRRVLNDEQRRWHIYWRGQVAVVTTIGEALIAVGLLPA